MEQSGWAVRLVQSIAAEVRLHRLRQHISAQDLADECENLGYPIARQVITNLENGRRDSISVAELIALGNALGVPPSLLVFPVGRTGAATSEALPGQERPTWEVFQWFTGQGPYPDRDIPDEHGPFTGDAYAVYLDGAKGAYMYHQEDQYISQWCETRHATTALAERLTKAPVGSAERGAYLEAIKAREDHIQAIERDIIKHRKAAEFANIHLRPLPEELSHLER